MKPHRNQVPKNSINATQKPQTNQIRPNSHKMNNRRTSSSLSTKCQKHPKHQQSPGICSACLRERLLKISRSSSRVITCPSSSSGSSSVSSISSASSSSGALSNTASPLHDHTRKHLSFLKSKSMAFASERIIIENHGGGRKKGGFWSKLMHSRTMLTTRV